MYASPTRCFGSRSFIFLLVRSSFSIGIEKEENIHYVTPLQLLKALADFEMVIPDLKIDFPSVSKVYPKIKEQLINAGIVMYESPLLYRSESNDITTTTTTNDDTENKGEKELCHSI